MYASEPNLTSNICPASTCLVEPPIEEPDSPEGGHICVRIHDEDDDTGVQELCKEDLERGRCLGQGGGALKTDGNTQY